MKVLVTGATGFLGQKTAFRLMADGYEVTGIGRNAKAGKVLEQKGIHFFQVDLSAQNPLEIQRRQSAFSGQDFVIHCAALSSPWGRFEDFYSANVVGTENVLACTKAAGIKRLVHVSTPSVYVDNVSRINIAEADPLPRKSINYYSQTKLMAEARVDEAVRQGLAVVTIRPQGIIGPGDSSILPRLIRIAKKGILPVIGTGESMIDLTYVDNVVEALVLALQAPDKVLGRKYNISNGEPVKLYQTLEQIFSTLGFSYKRKNVSFRKAYAIAAGLEFVCRNVLTRVEPILTCYSVCLLGCSRTLNIEAARKDLAYNPRVSMQEAIARIVADYRATELTS